SEDSADEPREECDRAERPGQCPIDGKAVLDVEQNEGENGEVEPIEYPAQERRPEARHCVAFTCRYHGPAGCNGARASTLVALRSCSAAVPLPRATPMRVIVFSSCMQRGLTLSRRSGDRSEAQS